MLFPNIFFAIQLIFAGIFFSSNINSSSQDLSKDILQDREMKILVLVIASDQLPIWHELQNVWRSYMHLDPQHVEAYFIKNNPNLSTSCEIRGDIIWSKDQETFVPGVLNKTITSLEFLLPRFHEFDFIIRTNVSSFFVFPRLLKFVQNLPKTRCYCGYCYPDWVFICGAGIIFSPDVAELLVQHKGELVDSEIIDDVAIGYFLSKHNINKIPTLPMFIPTIEDWILNKNNISEDVFFIRPKNNSNELRMRDEVYIQWELVKMFYKHAIK